jgi:hypothetical protein
MHRKARELLDHYLYEDNLAKIYAGRPLGPIHLAVLMKRGKIIADAYNNIVTKRYNTRKGQCTSTIHAERNVVRALGDISRIRGADMYVMRIYRVDTRNPLQPAEPVFVRYKGPESAAVPAPAPVPEPAPCPSRGPQHYKGSEPCCECGIFLDKCVRQYGLRNIYYTSYDRNG